MINMVNKPADIFVNKKNYCVILKSKPSPVPLHVDLNINYEKMYNNFFQVGSGIINQDKIFCICILYLLYCIYCTLLTLYSWSDISAPFPSLLHVL